MSRLEKIEAAALKLLEAANNSDEQDDWLLPMADLFDALEGNSVMPHVLRDKHERKG